MLLPVRACLASKLLANLLAVPEPKSELGIPFRSIVRRFSEFSVDPLMSVRKGTYMGTLSRVKIVYVEMCTVSKDSSACIICNANVKIICVRPESPCVAFSCFDKCGSNPKKL